MLCFRYTEKLIDLQDIIVKRWLKTYFLQPFSHKCLTNRISAPVVTPLPIKSMITESSVSRRFLPLVNLRLSLSENAGMYAPIAAIAFTRMSPFFPDIII